MVSKNYDLSDNELLHQLLNCPFCGHSCIILLDAAIDENLFIACCTACGCDGPFGKTPQEAINKWNMRAT